jgi:hypothetical protein
LCGHANRFNNVCGDNTPLQFFGDLGESVPLLGIDPRSLKSIVRTGIGDLTLQM